MTTTSHHPRPRPRRLLRALGAAVLICGLAACGTTTRDTSLSGNESAAGLAQPGLNGPSGTTGADTAAPGAVTGTGSNLPPGTIEPSDSATGAILPNGPGTSATTSGSQPGGGSAPGATTGGGGSGTGSSASTGTTPIPITDGPGKLPPVEIGVGYVPDADAFANLFGLTTKVGDQLTEAQAAINWINAHGGLGGHPMVPEFFAQSALSTTPYADMMSDICTSWTQDHHVAAGLIIVAAATDQLPQCLDAHGVAYLSGGTYPDDQTSYDQMPLFYSPYEASVDQGENALLNVMLSNGSITSKDKVGVLLADNEPAEVRTYKDVVEPKLKARGVHVSAYDVEFPSATLDAANSLNEISNDQLHMRSDGVTTVLFLAPGGATFLTKDADNQGWKPKYGLTSIDQPLTVAQSSSGSAAELVNSTAIGWQPDTDVGTYGNAVFQNSATALCQSIEGPTGQITGETSQVAAYEWCDALLSLQAGINAEGKVSTLTGALVAQGMGRIGNRTSAIALGEDITSSHHAGADYYRVMHFSGGCSCYSYTSGPVHF